MGSPYSIIIDAYSHISPPKYTETLRRNDTGFYNQILGNSPPLFDLDYRFRIMETYPRSCRY